MRSTAIFHRLLVILDPSPSSKAVLAQALDLAWRLQIPVHGVLTSVGASAGDDGSAPAGWRQLPNWASSQGTRISSIMEEAAHDYATACARAGVPWQWSPWDGRLATGPWEPAKPTDLLTFGQTVRPDLKKALLREALRPGFPPLLVCSPVAARFSRALVVDRADGSDGPSFVASAIALCHRLQAHSIVLTVARSERSAQARQQLGREAAAACGLDADFDFIVGADVPAAVARVAQWRRCSLVIRERCGFAPWWRRRPASAAWPVDSAVSLSLLTLPGVGAARDFAAFPTPDPSAGSLTYQGLLPVAR